MWVEKFMCGDLSSSLQRIKLLMKSAEELESLVNFTFHLLLINDTKRSCIQVAS